MRLNHVLRPFRGWRAYHQLKYILLASPFLLLTNNVKAQIGIPSIPIKTTTCPNTSWKSIKYSDIPIVYLDESQCKGRVGIGTQQPKAKLDIKGYPTLSENFALNISRLQNNNENSLLSVDYSGKFMLNSYTQGGLPILTVFPNGTLELKNQDGNSILKVNSQNSTTYTREVIVDLASWPDYVFHPDYKLPSLNKVEEYIQLNKRLPGFPSAVNIETNGLPLGEMNKLLTEKVEELTLYIIAQQKEMNVLKEEQDNLKELLETLRNEISELSKKNN